jgi:XTP/dITP diphosphohydrolase
MSEILFATNNKHKLEEVRSILGPDFRVLSLSDVNCTDELPETRSTFSGNAEQKARFVFDRVGMPCFADDSGLEVDALNGQPGVLSARYAGGHGDSQANSRLLLKNLEGVTNRSARFQTVIAFIGSEGAIHFFEGTIGGTILNETRGTAGFGYDPVFVPDGHSRTFAEMSLAEKNAISHRTLATGRLAAYLKEISR